MLATSTALMIATAASIASAASAAYGQKIQADAQSKANQAQYNNTMMAYRANVDQTNLAQQQEHEAAVQKLEQNNMAARAAMSKSVVGAGESGISGLSVDSLLGDLAGKQSQYNSSVLTNYDRSQAAINNQRTNVYANAASTINSLVTPAQPDYLGAGLKIANSVANYNVGMNGIGQGQSLRSSFNSFKSTPIDVQFPNS